MIRVTIVQKITKYYFLILEKKTCIFERKLGNFFFFLTAVVSHVACYIQLIVNFTSMTVVVL